MIQGDIHPDFWPVARVLEQQVRRSGGGAAVGVYHRGRPVVDIWAGKRAPGGKRWEHDTMAMSFSTTKGVASTLLHILVDRGVLDYDDPVAKHWPEFAQAGKQGITVRQVLSHRAGLHALRWMVEHGEEMLDWDHMLGVLAAASPAPHTVGRPAYHGLTFGWLVGGLIERATGRRFADVLREELTEPLGLDGCFIGAPPEAQSQAAELARPSLRIGERGHLKPVGRALRWVNRNTGLGIDPVVLTEALMPREGADVFWHPRILDTPIPAANGLFSARSLARLYAALAGAGQLDDVRLMSRETLARATEVQTRRRDAVVPVAMHWRLGYHRAFTARGALKYGFGHFGFGGSGAWADPKRDLSVAMINNPVAGGPFGDLRMLRIGTAAVRCADRL